ncbi:MAG: hypothetical protein QM762_06485 [Chryseolinea sp.]
MNFPRSLIAASCRRFIGSKGEKQTRALNYWSREEAIEFGWDFVLTDAPAAFGYQLTALPDRWQHTTVAGTSRSCLVIVSNLKVENEPGTVEYHFEKGIHGIVFGRLTSHEIGVSTDDTLCCGKHRNPFGEKAAADRGGVGIMVDNFGSEQWGSLGNPL